MNWSRYPSGIHFCLPHPGIWKAPERRQLNDGRNPGTLMKEELLCWNKKRKRKERLGLFSLEMLQLREKINQSRLTERRLTGTICCNLVGTFQTPVQVLLHRAGMYPTLYLHEAVLARNSQAVSLHNSEFLEKIYKLIIRNLSVFSHCFPFPSSMMKSLDQGSIRSNKSPIGPR